MQAVHEAAGRAADEAAASHVQPMQHVGASSGGGGAAVVAREREAVQALQRRPLLGAVADIDGLMNMDMGDMIRGVAFPLFPKGVQQGSIIPIV